MSVQVIFNGCRQLLFRRRVIFLRHFDIVQNIGVAFAGNKQPARNLRVVVIRPLRNDFKFLRCVVVIHFKIASGYIAGLENNVFDKSADFIIIRIKIQSAVPEVIYCKSRTVIVFRLFRPDRRNITGAAREYAGEGFFFVAFHYAVFVGVPFHVLYAAGHLQA